MTAARFVQKICLIATALVVATLAAPVSASAGAPSRDPAGSRAAAYRHHASAGDSLVRCTLMRQPTRRGRQPSRHGNAGLFAPTSQAVFFARVGDRCVWHAGAAVRG